MSEHEMLERELEAWSGMPYVVACSSGTAALHLALEALRMSPGSEVVMCDYNMIACPRAAVLAGMRPKFVDCDERLLMQPSKFHEAVGVHTAAVLATHIYGRQCTMAAIAPWAKSHDLWVVEDLAEAHGVRPYHLTDAACWSFYRNKIVHGEEGGAVGFRNRAHAATARALRSMGFTSSHDYYHIKRGCNYRLADLLARPIRESLVDVERNLSARKRSAARYDGLTPAEWRQPPRNVDWVYDVRIPGMTFQEQAELVSVLNGLGIAARHGFKPMSDQEEFRCTTNTPNAHRAASEIVYLPLLVDEEAAIRAVTAARTQRS